MNGPQHFREAERLADQANHYTYGDGADSVAGQAFATEALVHATLALVALGVETSVMHPSDAARPDVAEWRTVLDPPPPAPEGDEDEWPATIDPEGVTGGVQGPPDLATGQGSGNHGRGE